MFDELPETRAERWALLARLIADWESPLLPEHQCSVAEIDAAEGRLGIPLPTALSEWYLLAGRHGRVWQQQDSFELPSHLRIVNDKLIIYVENQGVVSWGISRKELSNPDPPVLVGDGDDVDGWKPASETTSAFALAMFTYCRKFSNRNMCYGAGSISSDMIPFVTHSFSRMPLEFWHWPVQPFQFFHAQDVVMELDGADDGSWLYVSAISEPAFRAVEKRLFVHGLTWEVSSDEWPRGWMTRPT